MTNENLIIAMFFASYRVLLSLAPDQTLQWRAMLSDVGLDPDDNSTDLSTLEGIGNVAGNAVVAARENDGMDQLGNEAVRPFSAIEYLYGDGSVAAWGGPGKGTVTDLPASEWQSYLPVANHPEYPSASASFCAAEAQVARHYLESDALDWSIDVAQGASRIEPGVTPQIQ